MGAIQYHPQIACVLDCLSPTLTHKFSTLCSQGYGIGRYDILFATNVLHATRNMEVTIQNCKALLCKGGLLIANELSAKTEFLTLTFGLTEGWWLYDDVQRRIPGNPSDPPSLVFFPTLSQKTQAVMLPCKVLIVLIMCYFASNFPSLFFFLFPVLLAFFVLLQCNFAIARHGLDILYGCTCRLTHPEQAGLASSLGRAGLQQRASGR